jgi:hypothetical protein
MFCKEQVAQLRTITGEIHKAGAELVVVGNGSPQQAQWFAEDTGLETPLFTDPSLRVYQEADAHRPGLEFVLKPATYLNALRAMSRGHISTRTKGDAAQLGGVFVVLPDGSVPYAQRSTVAGDHADPREVLAALEGAVGARG